MNAVVIGHVCIDTNRSESIAYTGAGGPAIFISKIYHRIPGVDLTVIAPYGKDFLRYTRDLTFYPRKPISGKTLVYENFSKGNIRTQKAKFLEYAKLLPINKEIQRILQRADLIFVAPLTPDFTPLYLKDLFEEVKTSIKILLPQGYFRSFDQDNVIKRDFIEDKEIVPLFDFVIVSDQDHPDMKSMSKKWSSKTNVIMTLGDKGAVSIYKGKKIFAPTRPVKVVDIIDSVGSGDIFSASFGYKYYQTKDIKKSLLFANDIARQCLFSPASDLKFEISD